MHIENNDEKYTDGANSVFFNYTSKSLFIEDVFYRKACVGKFGFPW